MCTVIVGYKLFDRQPIVIAANRDELLDRPTAPPATEDETSILAPKDLQRGGTPIGVNGRGAFAAITNRFDVESVGGQASRGYLPLMALMEETAHAAMLRITALDARQYNGFNLVIGDEATGLYVIRGDGAASDRPHPYVQDVIPPTGDGFVVVSNLGVGPDHAPRAEEVMRLWQGKRLMRHPPHRATWDALLTIHDPFPNQDASWMKRMASTCIHRPADDNYGTKSSAFILLDGAWGRYGAEWRWWHRERPASGGHNCMGRWEHELKLPIAPSRDG
jgi:hypothetical protein